MGRPGSLIALAMAWAGVAAWAADAPRAPLRLPPDRVFAQAKDSPGPVVFQHATHVALARWSCLGCHPAPFRMLSPRLRPSHAEMDAGRECGSCHNGRAAFATDSPESCELCHGAPAAPDFLSQPIILKHPDAPAPVVFSHARHVPALGRCSACHPALFARRAAELRYAKPALVQGQACGSCHDGKRALSVENEQCDKCHTTEAVQ